ncbi:putative protein FAM90A26, partial [Mesocricetus auratus]|uniref:Zinc knuckle domain-containing protein n=1 Tax=Mesocricetus auratus TaxID=10036 RepID=A0ABM2X8N3_MESAU
MDPNKLSMEEGKEFLKLCGIPQRDIDLMTEKWEVVASVEALIRFPLLPGEDPTARCISRKNSQPAVSQRDRIPQNNEDQEKRKNNNQSLKDFDKKPHVTKVMTRHCIETPSERPTGEKIQKINCFGAVRKRTKPEEEKETTVKSKKCCSFAHTARSKMCLLKHWHEALPVQPLGSNNQKEMMNPMEARSASNENSAKGIFEKLLKEENEQRGRNLFLFE